MNHEKLTDKAGVLAPSSELTPFGTVIMTDRQGRLTSTAGYAPIDRFITASLVQIVSCTLSPSASRRGTADIARGMSGEPEERLQSGAAGFVPVCSVCHRMLSVASCTLSGPRCHAIMLTMNAWGCTAADAPDS